MTCNHARRQESVKNRLLRSVNSITYGCDWSIRFRVIIKDNNTNYDHIAITIINVVQLIRVPLPILTNSIFYEHELVNTSVMLVNF